MKIVQIIPSFNVGGGELLTVRLCAEIMRQRPDYSVTLISLYDPIPSIVYDEALASGVNLLFLGKKKGLDPFILLRMVKVLRSIKPDVIHCHLAGLRYTLLAACMCRDSLKLHTVHSMAEHEVSRVVKHVHKFAFKHLGWIPVALSPNVRKSILDVYGVDAPIVNNGIGINKSIENTNKKSLREEAGLPLDRRIIITIGRLWKEKNQSLLIDAFTILCNECNDCSLLIVGEDPTDGSFRKFIEDKINELPTNIKQNIYLLGSRKDIPELLTASDIFVLSSDWEGVPLTLLEAMGYGIPVVCTSVGGMKDVVEHGIDGLLFPRGDVNELVKSLLKLLNNNDYAIELSNNAKKKYTRLYSIEMTTHGYLELYKRK